MGIKKIESNKINKNGITTKRGHKKILNALIRSQVEMVGVKCSKFSSYLEG